MKKLYLTQISIASFLLFLIQPLAAKTLLPHFGGGQNIWTVSIFFFQLLLLCAYFYAHITSTHLSLRKQVLLHSALLLASLIFVPLIFRIVDFNGHIEVSLLVTLFVSIALPFFMLSSNSSMLQKFYFRQNENAHDVYRFYKFSNFASFLGLLIFPLCLEIFFTNSFTTKLWSVCYYLFCAVTIYVLYKNYRSANAQTFDDITTPEKVSGSTITKWIIYSFIPSAMFISVTSYITTDIGSMPLLWILPLAIYLASFTIAFHDNEMLAERYRMGFLIFSAFVTLLVILDIGNIIVLPINLLFIFGLCCYFHNRLYQIRPKGENLTQFYLCMAVGGALGGFFTNFIAPNIFNDVYEYHLLLALALLTTILISPYKFEKKLFINDLALIIIAVLIYNFIGYANKANDFHFTSSSLENLNIKLTTLFKANGDIVLSGSLFALGIILLFGLLRFQQRTFSFFILITALLLCKVSLFSLNNATQYIERNFFGVIRILDRELVPTGGQPVTVRSMRSGTTSHGFQIVDKNLQFTPTSYYTAPFDGIFDYINDNLQNPPVAVVGLGIGTVACYGKDNQQYDFYEINPLVAKLASDKKYFSYISDCPPKKNLIIGDGRITLAKAEPKKYGLIVADAFSSDFIPFHLLTIESLEMMLTKLHDGGIIMYHISNQHYDFRPVLGKICSELELYCRVRPVTNTKEKPIGFFEQASMWVVISTDDLSGQSFMSNNWQQIQSETKAPWRDDYYNIYDVIMVK